MCVVIGVPLFQLANTEEYIEGQLTGQLGDVLIRCGCNSVANKYCMPPPLLLFCVCRCNNVLYVRGIEEEEEDGEMKE